MDKQPIMRVKYWGARGSIPAPLTPHEVRNKLRVFTERLLGYGIEKVLTDGNIDPAKLDKYLESLPPSVSGTYSGNTTSVEIQVKDAPLIMIDCGTGARLLGLELMKRVGTGNRHFNPLAESREIPSREVHLFLSHLHWDHIQGFPFFVPAFVKGTTIHVYGRANSRKKLEGSLEGQQEFPNFPVEFHDLPAEIECTEMRRFGTDPISLKSAIVTPMELSHPDGVFAYRIDATDKFGTRKAAYAFATDTEQRDVEDPRLVKLAKGAQVLYYDAQYTPEEYPGKIDWGHSTFIWAVRTALAAEVPMVVLGHHEPVRDDFALEEVLDRARKFKNEQLKLPQNEGKKLKIVLAQEGLMHEFEEE